MNDDPIEAPRGASVWEADMIKLLSEHVQQERGLLEEYEHVATETNSKALVYVVNLLLDDERRHHRLFIELAKSMRTSAELSGAEPVVPDLDFHRANRQAVMDITARLIDREEQDARELKRLRHDLRQVEQTTLWGLLVDVMQRDTDKHIAILKFAHKQAKTHR